MFTVISPLKVLKTKTKYFLLNLNQYRNTHYQTLNKVKINYKLLVKPQIEELPEFNRIGLMFTLFPATKHLMDVSNVCSIHEKFFADALVELGKLPDDNYLHIPETGYKFGHIDKSNPRVEIQIISLE